MKAYFYDGKCYRSEQEVRNAIMKKDRKVFGAAPVENEAEFWKRHNVILDCSEPSLSALKSQKKLRVKMQFLRWQNKSRLNSSLGFVIDANSKARSSIDDLLNTLSDSQTIKFRDANNEYHDLTVDQLKVLKSEVALNSIFAYEQKWELERQIAEAPDEDSLMMIRVKFDSKDFGKEV